MIHPDHIFKDTLYGHETPLSGKASFQGVMQKRNNKRRGFFWFSLNSVLLLLLSLTAVALFRSPVPDNTKIADNNSIHNANLTNLGGRRYVNNKTPEQKESNSVIKNENASSNSNTLSNVSGNLAGRRTDVSIVAGKNPQRLYLSSSYKQNGSLNGIKSGNFTALGLEETEVSDHESSNHIVSDNKNENQTIRELSDWLKHLSGRGISEEKFFKFEPTKGMVLPEFVPFYPPRKAKFNPIFELNATTAGKGYKSFRESQDVTVAGNHRLTRYMGILLFDMGRGVNIGTGISYSECVGIGKALVSTYVIDTTLSKPVRVTKAQNISYRLNKISVPLAIRYQLGFGRSMVRISFTAMPGVVSLGSGTIFSRDALQSMDMLKRNSFVMDARLGAGLYYQVAPKTAISAEPIVQYQSIPGSQWKTFNRFDFGFGLGVVFRP